MKYIFYYITAFVLGIALLNSCETDDNGPMPNNIEEGCLGYVDLDATSSKSVDFTNLGSFVISGSVEVLFEPKYDKLELMVVFNKDFKNQYLLMDNITSTPHHFSFTIDDLINVIPTISSRADIQLGDSFTLLVNATINGKEYPIYKTIDGTAVRIIGSGLVSALGAIKGVDVVFTADVACPYLPAMASGSYHAVSADWGFDHNITITVDPANPYIVYVSGLASEEGLDEISSLKMTINPDSYNVTADKQIIAPNVAPWGLPYVDYYYQSLSGKYNTCDGSYEMLFKIGISIGNWGGNAFTFTRN